MSDTGGRRLFSTESFAANADIILMRAKHSIYFGSQEFTPGLQ